MGPTLRTVAAAVVPLVAVAGHRRAARTVARQPALAPPLPGRKVLIPTAWGSVSYRHRPAQSAGLRPLVLIHGWGRTADTAWWRLYPHLPGEVLAVDLPGHGLSDLEAPFTFARAAEAVLAAVEHAGLSSPVLVGHSMGGPVAVETAAAAPERFSRLVAVATSAFWVRPRTRVMMAAAPYVLGDRSPLVLGALHRAFRRDPANAGTLAWSHTVRPRRRVLAESAIALRRFDVRGRHLRLPATTWVVTADDGVVAPRFQRRSARLVGADVVEIAADHSAPLTAPELVADALRAAALVPRR